MRALAIGALLLALAAPVGAEHCTTYETSVPDLDTGPTPAGRYYVADDCFPLIFCQVEIVMSFWIYEESNGLAGLQRGDDAADDTCHQMIAPDTVIS